MCCFWRSGHTIGELIRGFFILQILKKKMFLIQTSNNVFVLACIGTFPKALTGDLNNPERVAFWRGGRQEGEGGRADSSAHSNNDGMVRHSYRLVVTRLGPTP